MRAQAAETRFGSGIDKCGRFGVRSRIGEVGAFGVEGLQVVVCG